jgi:predicted ferric reductase
MTAMTTRADLKADPKTETGGRLRLIDWLILSVVVGVSAAAFYAVWQAGAFGLPLASDPTLSWHMVRAAGLTAYALLGASTLWGLLLSSRVIKDWSPGPVALLLHTTVSWLAVGLSLAHAGMLMFDSYYKYSLTDLFVPFTGPYRPFAVGLGTLSAWLVFVISISFSVRKRLGQRNWRWLHYTSYIAFVMITVHALLAGTDAQKPGMQILMGGFAASITALLAWRILLSVRSRQAKAPRRVAQVQGITGKTSLMEK